MKKFIKMLGVTIGLACFAVILTPQEKIDGLKTSWARLFGDPPQLCLDYERGGLKDPDSAALLDARVNGFRVSIDYKAKNSYGAYIRSTAVCAVIDGKIDEMTTLKLRALEEATASYDCQIRRNERALELMQKGRSKAEAWSENDCPPVELDELNETLAKAKSLYATEVLTATVAGIDGEALYKQACAVCHAAGVAGAPKFGDKTAWAPRVALGLDGLTASAIKGKNAMPAKGGSTASDADIKAAVQYMLAAVK
jgi:cytochrome c5